VFNRLHSVRTMRTILERERRRSDRHQSSFALLSLTFPSRCEAPEIESLADIFENRLRATDEAGMLGRRAFGVVLPETSAEGAYKLAEDICNLLPADHRRPQVTVYVYPLDDEANDDSTRDDNWTRKTKPMQDLFVQPLPVWKRLIDVVGASTALVAAAPVMLLVMALIKWQSPGPAIYKQQRIGRHRRRFHVFKFRTMVCDADRVLHGYLAACPLRRAEWERDHKLRDDPRITAIGRWLRKTSLDELPQLWNVLRGEMSLVGPRPIVTAEIVKYANRFAPYCNVLPGITGLWQISGRNDTTYAERVELDSFYSRNATLWLDLYILLKTVRVVLFRQGAY
jgi:Undecaprenyl-phosphate galactose phosphotransferase WbaP